MNSCNYRIGKSPNVRDKKPQKVNGLILDRNAERFREMVRVEEFRFRNDFYFRSGYLTYGMGYGSGLC